MLRFATAVNCAFLTGLWQKYGSRVRKFVRFAVLLACTVVVIIQLGECFSKLFSPPISSHLRLVVNQSMTYPAVTICRYPSYKPAVLQKYNLQNIRTTKKWEDFPFGEITLGEFWNEATYRLREGYFLSALSGYLYNVRIKSAYYLIWGQCHTILPLIQTTSSSKTSGYSVMLRHVVTAYNRSVDDPEEGWYIFLHPATDPWIESTEEHSGTEESLLLAVGEELHVKISVQEYHRVDKADDRCNASLDHSYEEGSDVLIAQQMKINLL
jgi:hypothetical protein